MKSKVRYPSELDDWKLINDAQFRLEDRDFVDIEFDEDFESEEDITEDVFDFVTREHYAEMEKIDDADT